MKLYRDRREAGWRLGMAVRSLGVGPSPLVLGLPRGGVPVGFEVAMALDAPLDVFAVRKLGVPGREELAMGAIASGGVRVLNDEVVSALGIDRASIDAVTASEERELLRREHAYRNGFPPHGVEGRAVVLVDDGLATGATMLAAAAALRERLPACVVVAAPVGSLEACRMLAAVADEVVCPATPEPLDTVSRWYGDFTQTEDGEVHALLLRARDLRRAATLRTGWRAPTQGIA